MRHESSYQIRWCQDCRRDTKHRAVDSETGADTATGIGCCECSGEELTAWLVRDDLLMHVVVTDDRDSVLASRPLPYGRHELHQASRALTALGFTRVTGWVSTTRDTTSTVRRR